MVWREGVLPPNAPEFSELLSYDLLSYGYRLLSDGLDLLETEGGDSEDARRAFEFAASAIESVVARGEPDEDRDFHRFIAASAYHLARYSARAFSMLNQLGKNANRSLAEQSLTMLMLRDLEALQTLIFQFKQGGQATDHKLVEVIANIEQLDDSDDASDALTKLFDMVLTDSFFSAMSGAMLAFERGDAFLLELSRSKLKLGLSCAADLNFVPQWWVHRIAIFLLGDLWDASFHKRLPLKSSAIDEAAWTDLRSLFIASLFKRHRAEIELWPSQLTAAARAVDIEDNLVVSLPTSAGKTRIAELCILACIASGKRVIFVTPLRALSAQTETSLARTFTPLGKSVSNLYGSIGVGDVDKSILRTQDIIVATPEKLDFALRNEPSLLDDVGLVVLDEGHMIGLGEREVRYEVQIQRLLRRKDAKGRRIICLSAILPSDDKLDDFVDWLTDDDDTGVIQNDWRPTRLRFGVVEWRTDHGRLQLTVGEEKPFVPRFIEKKKPTSGKRKAAFPRDQRELCLATTWRLVEDGQSVLIFCPLRKSVEPFAEAIVDLHERGLLSSVLQADASHIDAALNIGAEWFDSDHAILKCLKLGVAIHHGSLPTPFRREVEKLLRSGVLKVTISSPTLAQGLNLSATALVFHGLYRNKKIIEVSEFRNVIGRAGRAFIDLEGLVLFPIFSDVEKNRENWENLVDDSRGKEMESGLLKLVQYLLARMIKKHNITTMAAFQEYVVNSAYWEFPVIEGERKADAEEAKKLWPVYVAMLDTAILGLIGDADIEDEKIEEALNTILQSSLWARRLERNDSIKVTLQQGILGRAKYIWSQSDAVQRRSYFLAGVGLDTGKRLDANADELISLIVAGNGAILIGSVDEAIAYTTSLAKIIFAIEPFAPSVLPIDWENILAAWLKGELISSLDTHSSRDTLKFIEDALVYRLPWGIEATRVRALAHGTTTEDGLTLDDLELGLLVPAIETGTLSIQASLLMKAGFASRTGAITVAALTNATFTTMIEMRHWSRSISIRELTQTDCWPTAETCDLWREFIASLHNTHEAHWKKSSATVHAVWRGEAPASHTPVRLVMGDGELEIYSHEYEPLGTCASKLEGISTNVIHATVAADNRKLDLLSFGPKLIQ